MNMRIAGRGSVPVGEYDKISISGCGRLFGEVRCNNFSASGSSKGESITCAARFKASGTSAFSGQVNAQSIRTAGSFSCGALNAEEISCSGSVKCAGDVACRQLSVSGSMRVDGDIEAGSVRVAGALHCGMTLRAESIELQADKQMQLKSIAGGSIRTRRKRISVFFKRRVCVTSAIEGDALDLEFVSAPRVTGRTVIIGKGCRIDLVEYRERVEIAPGAQIGKVEKNESDR